MECVSSFIKKTLRRAMCVEVRNKVLFKLFSDVIIQRNKLFILIDLLKFATKCVRGKIKAFSFSFLYR